MIYGDTSCKLDVTRTLALVQCIKVASDRHLMRSLQVSGTLAMLKYMFEVAGQVLLTQSLSRYIMILNHHHNSSSPYVHALLAMQKAQIEGHQRSIHPDQGYCKGVIGSLVWALVLDFLCKTKGVSDDEVIAHL